MIRPLFFSRSVRAAGVTRAARSFRASRSIRTTWSVTPLTCASRTPSMSSISGTIRSRTLERSSCWFAPPVTDIWMIGKSLMLPAKTCGSEPSGRPLSPRTARWASVWALPMSVSYSSVIMTVERLALELDSTLSTPRRPRTARSTGLVTRSSTAAEPAPGAGVTTPMTGNSIEGMSSRFRAPVAQLPATMRKMVSRAVSARLRRLRRERASTSVPVLGSEDR